MDGADIGEPATGGDDREWRSGPAPEEEHTGVLLARVIPPVGLRIDVVKHRPPGRDIVDHPVQSAEHRPGIDGAMVRHQFADTTNVHALVIATIVPREDATRVSREGRMAQYVSDRARRG